MRMKADEVVVVEKFFRYFYYLRVFNRTWSKKITRIYDLNVENNM